MKRTLCALVACACVPVALADLKPLDDAGMNAVTGQGSPTIAISGDITYDAIIYTDPQGNREVITPGGASANGVVNTTGINMKGATYGSPVGLFGLFSMFLPTTMGEVDTDGDGIADHGAAVINFKPNAFSTGTPIDITTSDTVVNVADQMFLTKQGIIILNAPLNNLYDINGQQYQYVHRSNGTQLLF